MPDGARSWNKSHLAGPCWGLLSSRLNDHIIRSSNSSYSNWPRLFRSNNKRWPNSDASRTNFGPKNSAYLDVGKDIQVRYGPPLESSNILGQHRYLAKDCHVTSDHVSITCMTVPGTGKGHVWALSVGNQHARFSSNDFVRTTYHNTV